MNVLVLNEWSYAVYNSCCSHLFLFYRWCCVRKRFKRLFTGHETKGSECTNLYKVEDLLDGKLLNDGGGQGRCKTISVVVGSDLTHPEERVCCRCSTPT